MRLVLIGDGDSPHLEKWVRALLAVDDLELWLASSRGFTPGIAERLPEARRLGLDTQPRAGGGNVALLRSLPRLARWLRAIQPDWLNAHYLSSHGTLAWLSQRCLGVGGKLAASAWGSDILVTPEHSRLMRGVTRRVLRHAALATSDSQAMAERMRTLGAGEVMTFPFGLEQLPAGGTGKEPFLCFANRGLEPLYDPQRVIETFAELAWHWPEARLVVAHDGTLRQAMERHVAALRLQPRVQFVGRLDAASQAIWYARAQWYLSLPSSDSVAVSVLEAMAHGCLPILSDLPANRELVRHRINGMLLARGERLAVAELNELATRATQVAQANRDWVAQHAMFAPAVARFVRRLRELA